MTGKIKEIIAMRKKPSEWIVIESYYSKDTVLVAMD
jgi:hypothetical protein